MPAQLITLPDGSRCHLHSWLPQGPAKAVVQIVHGMAEHGGRYARFAAALNAEGYAVYAQDLPGHGLTAANLSTLGCVEGSDPFRSLVTAVNQVRSVIEAAHPGLPLVLFGHSLGSFVAQQTLVEHGAGLTACVLSGTSGTLGPLRAIGVLINRVQIRLFGPHHKSALTEALTFKAFNKQFAPTRTSADWLSRDAAEVDAYVQSPLCGFRCGASLWLSLLQAGAGFTDKGRIGRIPKGLPLLLIAGGKDPVCEGEKGPALLAAAYREAGLAPELRIYPQARHELLNETNRDEVTSATLNWLQAHVHRAL